MIISPKVKWLSLLFLATNLFLIGMHTQQILFFFGTVVLTFYIRKNGYNYLFRGYDEKQKNKSLRAESVMKLIQQNRRLGKKKKD